MLDLLDLYSRGKDISVTARRGDTDGKGES